MQTILFYTDTPLFGGAEIQMLLLAKFMDHAKFRIVLVYRDSTKLADWANELRKIPNVEVKSIRSKSKNSLSLLFNLHKIIRELQPDLIHAHLWNPMACKHLFALKPLLHCPIIVTEHDPFALGKIKNLYKKTALNFTNKIITVSRANKKLLQELYPKHAQNMECVHNGIDLSIKQSSNRSIEQIRKQAFAVKKAEQIILTVGTLHTRKGFKYLLLAMPKILRRFPNCKVALVGEGPEKANLQKLIKNLALSKHAILCGQRSDIADLMKAADLFVLPSLKEAFGLVILEAMRAGLPVVASRVGGIPEIISEKSGIMVKAGNKQDLSKSIIKILGNKALQSALHTESLKRVKEFSAEKMARETEKIYTSLITRHA